MKIARTLIVALMAICFFGSAKAQVSIKARIGAPPQHHEVVVVHHPVHRVVVHHYRHKRVIIRRRR